MTEQEKNIQIVKDMFSAYGKGDIKTITDSVADHVDWKCPVMNDLSLISWAKPRHNPLEVQSFFNASTIAACTSSRVPVPNALMRIE